MEYVDYRRYADYGKSAATTAIEGARGRAAEARVEEPPAPDAAATLPDRLPVWWLFFLPLYWFPQSINWGLIQTYLLPFEVEDIVGQSRKQFFLSLMVTSSNVGSFFGPVWGAMSDAAVGKDGRRRRRPIIVVGQLLFVLACTVMATAESFTVLLLSFMLFTMTATISGAPYTVTNTAVPLEQRGLFNALWSYQSIVCNLLCSGLGVLVGEKLLSRNSAYMLAIAVALFPTLPIGLVGLGERPPTRERWWQPEPKAPPQLRMPEPTKPCSERCTVTLADFVSAFKYPPFRWLFITNVCNTVYGTFSSLFFIYWFQDEVGKHGFYLLGRHITNAPQTALAFTGTIGTFCGFFLTAPGGWIADRYPHQRAQLLFVSAFLQTACPIVNAYWPTFTAVAATTLFSGLTGGLTSTCGRAITADCVPVDPVTLVPIAPARDFMVASYASIIPSLIIPAILGVVFDLFASKDEAYKVFFLVSAAIHAASAFLYLVVHQKQKEARELIERENEKKNGSGRMEYTKHLAATRVEDYRRQMGAKEPLLGGSE